MKKILLLTTLGSFLILCFTATASPPAAIQHDFKDSIESYVVYEAIMPVVYSYEKKKFQSFCKKRNRWNKQRFGIEATEPTAASYIDIDEPVDTGLVIEIWQWLASNVKDQS